MIKQKQIVAVLGAGNMGTAIAQVLADNGNEVRIWNWEGDHIPLRQIEKNRENKKYLPGVKLSKNIIPKNKIEEALENAEVVFFVVPSGAMEYTISFAARSIKNNAILVDISKGIEPNSLRLIPHIIIKHVRPELKKNVVTVSGPAVAGQMVAKQFTAMNIASKNKKAIKKVIEVFANKYIRLIPTTDVVGVEIGGSFKNVYAIAVGMCDGMGYGLNTKAAILTKSLEEIANLIGAVGGRKHTAYELAGLGDLIGTSLCSDSRNRTLGEYMGQGMTAKKALKKIKQTTEGIDATKCLLRLAKKHKVEVPFAKMIGKCIDTTGNPKNILHNYLLKGF